MADKKAKQAAGEIESERKIAVTNTYRNQPLLFHVPGGSVRLGPLETREISREFLASPELSRLVLTGAVRVRDVEPPEPAEEGDGAARRGKSATGRGPGSSTERDVEAEERDAQPKRR
jgi:hypothetical protein